MRITFQYLVAAAIAAVVLGILLYFVLRSDAGSEQAVNEPALPTTEQRQVERAPVSEPVSRPDPTDYADVQPEPEAAVTEPGEPLVAAPADLSGSDASVLEVLNLLSPQLAKWLIPDEQIRKWVLTVDLMADGKLPKRYRPLDYPMEKFRVAQRDDMTYAADDNFARLTPLIEALSDIDSTTLARYYRAWHPLVEAAYREQGKPGQFEDRLLLAISRILAVEPLADNEPLVRPGVFYLYQNKTLEDATDVEKLGWRMGEDNLMAVQDFARSLRAALDPP